MSRTKKRSAAPRNAERARPRAPSKAESSQNDKDRKGTAVHGARTTARPGTESEDEQGEKAAHLGGQVEVMGTSARARGRTTRRGF